MTITKRAPLSETPLVTAQVAVAPQTTSPSYQVTKELKHQRVLFLLLNSRTLGKLASDDLVTSLSLRLGLNTHDTTTPRSGRLREDVIVRSLDGFDELGEFKLVFVLDRGERQRRGGLLVHNRAETSLALNDAVRHVHLLAQSREPDDEFNRVNVVRDAHELRLALLHEVRDVVDTELHDNGLLALNILTRGFSLRHTGEALLLLGRVLRAVLHEKLEQVRRQVLVQSVVELVDGRRDLQTLLQHTTLALDAHILRPLHVTVKRRLHRQRVTDAKVLRLALKQRVGRALRFRLRLFSLEGRRGFRRFSL